MNSNENSQPATYIIEWDMGEYGPFLSYGEARAFQSEHRMRGSSITEV